MGSGWEVQGLFLGGVPNIRSAGLGLSMTRVVAFGGVYIGPTPYSKYHLGLQASLGALVLRKLHMA